VPGRILDRAQVPQQLRPAAAWRGLYGCHRHDPGGDGPGLVQQDRVDAAGGFQRLIALDEDAQLRAAPACHHQRGRGRQPERARARNDEHGEGGADRTPRRGACDQPAGQGQRRRGEHRGHEHAADPVGEPLDGRLIRLGMLDQRDQLRHLGVLAGPGRPNHQPAGDDHGAGADRAAGGGVGGHRLAGHRAGVDCRLAELDQTVGRDRLAGPDHEPVTRAQRAGRDVALGSVRCQHARLFRARGGQRPHRIAGVSAGAGFIPAAGEQERGHRRGDFQVDAAAGGVDQ
jgi:hypothetical protein